MKIRLLIIFFLLCTLYKSYCQDKHNFSKVLSIRNVGIPFANKTNANTSWQTYLGIFNDKKRKEKFYVITEFRKNKAAITWHGHSTLYFIKFNRKLFASVDVGMPEDLPYKFSKNIFYFHFSNGAVKDLKTAFSSIPKVFCSEPSGCNDVIFE